MKYLLEDGKYADMTILYLPNLAQARSDTVLIITSLGPESRHTGWSHV